MEMLVKTSFCEALHRSVLPSVQDLLLSLIGPRSQPQTQVLGSLPP